MGARRLVERPARAAPGASEYLAERQGRVTELGFAKIESGLDPFHPSRQSVCSIRHDRVVAHLGGSEVADSSFQRGKAKLYLPRILNQSVDFGVEAAKID